MFTCSDMGNFGQSPHVHTIYNQYFTSKAHIYGTISVCLGYVRFYGEACKYTVVKYASIDNVISWKVISEKEPLTGDVSLRSLAYK